MNDQQVEVVVWRQRLALMLYFAALTISLVLVGAHHSIPIKRPWILLLASLIGFLPVKHLSVILIQRLCLAYFIGMLMSQLSLEFTTITSNQARWIIPKTLSPLILYAISFLFYLTSESRKVELKQNYKYYVCWMFLGVVYIIHMLYLGGCLYSVYGFGYEHDGLIIMDILLYGVCFIFTWDTGKYSWVRYVSFSGIFLLMLVLSF